MVLLFPFYLVIRVHFSTMENCRAKGKRERKPKKGERKRAPSDVAMANAVDEPLYVATSTPP
jgi:hypothetical protein